VAWPPAGYVPFQHIPSVWSLSGASGQVTMTRDGQPVPLRSVSVAEPGFGEPTLSWERTRPTLSTTRPARRRPTWSTRPR
jgi:hypothetical protein